MRFNAVRRAPMGALVVTVLGLLLGGNVLAGCGNYGNSGTAATGGSGGTSTIPSTGTMANGGSGGSGCNPADCSDNCSCTVDVCAPNGTCSHTVGPNEGATACPAGQYCTLESCCTVAPACATTDDCVAKWKDDACKAEIACDPVSSVCTFKILDKDGDGHPPPVCGGDDCDDSDPGNYPGNQEMCDSKDNNCNGLLDDLGANDDPGNCGTCGAVCGPGFDCQAGVCSCAFTVCGQVCVNTATDASNCGACGNACDVGMACESGKCVCSPGLTLCSGTCADLNLNNTNCGACGNACPGFAVCSGGLCHCPGAAVLVCNGVCTPTLTDKNNCGGCGVACPANYDCQNGACECTGMLCNGACEDIYHDENNCGMCGHVCAPDEFCDFGACVPDQAGSGAGGGP